jgi:DNA-binding CsgD family transcriptional regulator
MEAPRKGLNDKTEIRAAIWETIDEIDRAATLEAACAAIADIMYRLGDFLLVVKIADLDKTSDSVRPYSAFSEGVRREGRLLKHFFGGCVLHRESLARMRPFLVSEIPSERYSSFMERRFLTELEKLDYEDILIVPTIVGRGQALFAVGLHETPTHQKRADVVNMMAHFVAAMLHRFPEVGRLFEEKRLSALETQVLQLRCEGMGSEQITRKTGLSETVQNHIIEAAKYKLGAANSFELVRLATLSGEIGK